MVNLNFSSVSQSKMIGGNPWSKLIHPTGYFEYWLLNEIPEDMFYLNLNLFINLLVVI